MKKSIALRPVSQKAYAGFVDRINLIIRDSGKRAAMLAALDRYLEGDRDTYTSGLTLDCVMAFEMLRFDIDLAIARSQKARMRVRKSKTAVANQPSPIATDKSQMGQPAEQLPIIEDAEAETEPDPMVPHISRRQRRAITRSITPKSRWRKL